MSRLVLATRNAHKVEEMSRILAAAGVALQVVDVRGFPPVGEVEETGTTFAENAELKAVGVAAATGLPAVGDDSGLAVDALNGMPGILSARWSGAGDEANLRLVLTQVSGVPDERRGAAFVCSAALALPDGSVTTVTEQVRGRLLREPRGTGGFGYDPIFVPDGHTLSTAELAPDEKDALSHRGKALRALLPTLSRLG